MWDASKRFSGFWHNALKVIFFKKIYEEIDKNGELLIAATESNKKNSENISKILEKSKEYYQISEVREQILKENIEHYENFLKQNKEQNRFYGNQNRIEKSEYIKQSYEQNLQYIRQNRKYFTEYIDKTFGEIKQEVIEFIEQISELGNQNKLEYKNLITQNKKQYTEFLRENKERQRELTGNLLSIFDKQITTIIKQISVQVNQKNAILLEQITKNINHQILGCIEQISEENNKQNSVFIKQNSELINYIKSESTRNHGTINQKFRELVKYQTLSQFRENLIIIKTNMIILEKLDNTQLKIFHNLYMQYHKKHSEIPVLDVTQGILIIKILFPRFFTEMLANLSILKSQFEEESYIEITQLIKKCDYFFQNFIRVEKVNIIKEMLDSDIVIVDNMLAKIISY